MTVPLAIAGGAASWGQMLALVVVVVAAVGFLIVRAGLQRRAQGVAERTALNSFAGLRDSELAAEPWAEQLLANLRRGQGDSWECSDSGTEVVSPGSNDAWLGAGNASSPSADIVPDWVELLCQASAWRDIMRGNHGGRSVLSASASIPLACQAILIELAPGAAASPTLVIQPADQSMGSARVVDDRSEPVDDASAHNRDPMASRDLMAFGDDALTKSWAVQCSAPRYAKAVIDIAMRGRLFGIDARGMRFLATGRALIATFPAPASIELARDRLILLTEFAERIELHAEHAKPSEDAL